METLETSDRKQLKEIIRLLDQNINSRSDYFTIRKNGFFDEYIEANEAGTLAFAKELIRSVIKKRNNFSVLDYDLSKNNSDIWITYIQFVDENKTRKKKLTLYNHSNKIESLLFGVGFSLCIILIVIGAFTVANLIFDEFTNQ
jgi:hypothetical protein